MDDMRNTHDDNEDTELDELFSMFGNMLDKPRVRPDYTREDHEEHLRQYEQDIKRTCHVSQLEQLVKGESSDEMRMRLVSDMCNYVALAVYLDKCKLTEDSITSLLSSLPCLNGVNPAMFGMVSTVVTSPGDWQEWKEWYDQHVWVDPD